MNMQLLYLGYRYNSSTMKDRAVVGLQYSSTSQLARTTLQLLPSQTNTRINRLGTRQGLYEDWKISTNSTEIDYRQLQCTRTRTRSPCRLQRVDMYCTLPILYLTKVHLYDIIVDIFYLRRHVIASYEGKLTFTVRKYFRTFKQVPSEAPS